MNTCTLEDRNAIILAAEERKRFLLWLADRLEISDDRLIRKEAAAAIRQLVS